MNEKNVTRRIYVASSWRNTLQPDIVVRLRAAGHEVYDFHEPAPGQHGFEWREVSDFTLPNKIAAYFEAIGTGRAREGFELDKKALDWCDTCVLVLPCGRSAHLEAGYAVGQGKDVYFLLNSQGFEPELMYLLGTGCATTLEDIMDRIARRPPGSAARFHAEKGGHFTRPASHALRLLREVIELCVAAGASQPELRAVVDEEVAKEYGRDAFGSNPDAMAEEWADCALLLDVFRSYAGIDAYSQVRKKLDACWNREWEPDAGGALYRPGKAHVPGSVPDSDLYTAFMKGVITHSESLGLISKRVIGVSPLFAAPYGAIVTTSSECGEVPKVAEASFCWMYSASGVRRVVFSLEPPRHCIHGKPMDTRCADCGQLRDELDRSGSEFTAEERAEGFESKLDTER